MALPGAGQPKGNMPINFSAKLKPRVKYQAERLHVLSVPGPTRGALLQDTLQVSGKGLSF